VNLTRDDKAGSDVEAAADRTGVATVVAPPRPPTTYQSTSGGPVEVKTKTPKPPPPVSPAPAPSTVVEPAPEVPTGPRPRASALATMSLIVGLLAAVAVVTGQLVLIGIALGVATALLAYGGISATGRWHVAGRADALLGLLLGLASIVFGVLMMTGSVSWLSIHTNLLTSLYQWLHAHAAWTLPS
jgi:hypothetical protein